ncbi:MAG: VCBS repeat-containing protein [Deltaproteobacteria bacterium]|nr:VCBS repeat-containing protein [Deltaproteobacteria bacterium]
MQRGEAKWVSLVAILLLAGCGDSTSVECTADTDCEGMLVCRAGRCVENTECRAEGDLCDGNCRVCDEMLRCTRDDDTLCTGDCDLCVAGLCEPDDGLCDAEQCEFCRGSGTEFHCVQAIPAAPGAVTPSENPICAGDSTTLEAEVEAGGDDEYEWFEGSCEGTPLDCVDMTCAVSPSETTSYHVRRLSGGCPEPSDCASVTVQVSPPSVGGTVSGDSTQISPGQSTGTMTLSGHVGEVVRWQRRVDGGSWEPIANTTTTHSETPPSAGTWDYRARVRSSPCAAVSSAAHTIVVGSCTPDCTGRCGGPDGCGGTCTDTCGGLLCRPPQFTYCTARSSVEVLGRGLVALPKDSQVYLGWRWLPWDVDNGVADFHVYRATSASGPFDRVTTSPIDETTNCHDNSVSSGTTYYYMVRPVDGQGAEGPDSNLARVRAGPASMHIDIPMTITSQCQTDSSWGIMSWGGVGPGDINGDGVLDFAVLMYDTENGSQPYCLEAFVSADGAWESRWRITTRIPEASTTQGVVVWDMDGDGRAEIFTRIRSGGQDYLARLDPDTGAVAESTPWLSSAGGTVYGVLTFAYLEDLDADGLPEPFIVTQTGMYLVPAQNPRFAAYTWAPGLGLVLQRDVSFASGSGPYTKAMGTHGFYAADLDGDWLDEVIPCGSILNSDWSSYRVVSPDHSDACHPADIRPDVPGVELLVGSDPGDGILYSLSRELASEDPVLWSNHADQYNGWEKGWCEDVLSDPGMECALMDHDEREEIHWDCNGPEDCPFPALQRCINGTCSDITHTRLFNAAGTEIIPPNLEMLYQRPMDWNGADGQGRNENYMRNCGPGVSITGCMNGEMADVVGDSREDLMAPDFVNGVMRIYTNTAINSSRRVTPLADRGYRAAVMRLGGYGYNKVVSISNQDRFDMVPEPVDSVGLCEGQSAGHVCRPVRGACDVQEVCDGSSPDCPADAFIQGTLCRESTEGCDPPEVCSGSSPTCPPDINNCQVCELNACQSTDGSIFAGACTVFDADCNEVGVHLPYYCGYDAVWVGGASNNCVLYLYGCDGGGNCDRSSHCNTHSTTVGSEADCR